MIRTCRCPRSRRTWAGNLAPLCRRHHNAKTLGRWRYHRHPDGPGDTYTWTDPHDRTYEVGPDGTRPSTPPDAPTDRTTAYTLAT